MLRSTSHYRTAWDSIFLSLFERFSSLVLWTAKIYRTWVPFGAFPKKQFSHRLYIYSHVGLFQRSLIGTSKFWKIWVQPVSKSFQDNILQVFLELSELLAFLIKLSGQCYSLPSGLPCCQQKTFHQRCHFGWRNIYGQRKHPLGLLSCDTTDLCSFNRLAVRTWWANIYVTNVSEIEVTLL